MNTIYITKASKQKLIKNFKKEASTVGSTDEDTLIFHKKNKGKITKLTIKYSIYRRYEHFECNFSDNNDYNMNMAICDNEKNWINIPNKHYANGGRKNINNKNSDDFIIEPHLTTKVFGIDSRVNPFVYFNEFMLKYYHKPNYLPEYIDDWMKKGSWKWIENYQPKYKNCKKLKYNIIITKIIVDIIQNIKLDTIVNGR